jgi:hypothetical protein
MRRRTRSARPPKATRQVSPGSRRDRLAVLLALVTIACLGAAFLLGKGTHFLMPGPLASAHGAIENCSACHTKSGSGKFDWIHNVAAGDPLADSKACLTCHRMPNAALNPHGASAEALKQSTRRLTRVAAATPAPLAASAQSIVFPTGDVVAGGVYCANCHQEHQGVDFDLSKISNEQCGSCHVVKFDSFDGNHPKFDNYPLQRRTRIIYDHAGHFGKHFPEVTQKDPAKRIPATCSNCHNSREDKRLMAVASFEQTCSGCHADQITGKERVSGPKGIAFLTLPGLDLQTLKEKNASIGEWPEASEAELTSFMKVMISRNERGRALIKTVDGLNLQDLSNATGDQIKAVSNLVWEIKGLFYALISAKASDVLGDLNIGNGAKLSADLVADLTASIPRDVVISAHQEWLPNLATEMLNRQKQSGDWSSSVTESRLAASVSPEELAGSIVREAGPRLTEAVGGETASTAKPVRLAQASSDQTDDLLFPNGGAPPASNAPAAAEPAAAPPPAAAQPAAPQPAAAQRAEPAGNADVAVAQPQGNASGQTDDLLFPDGGAPAGSAVPDVGAPPAEGAPPGADVPANAPAGADNAAADAQPGAAPVISIESNVDPESWAEYGGWYQQDYAVFYRPTGHKDKFIYSWLVLTGLQPKGNKSPAAAVFEYLTSKDAQGSCTKCHSVDDIQAKGRLVNFSPTKIGMKQGRFTSFIHEPHFGILENRGCLTCHSLEKGRPYLKSYEQTDPLNFVSNFGAVKKELCQTCHTSNMARQDCLLCHKYHVEGVITPVMNTRIPPQ